MMFVREKALRFGAGLFGTGRFRRCKQRHLPGPLGPGKHFAAGPVFCGGAGRRPCPVYPRLRHNLRLPGEH
jgi:hypothetical protein